MGFYSEPNPSNSNYTQARWGRIVATVLLVIFIPIGGIIVAGPQYRLWRAGIERQIQVRDAESKAKAAVQLAQAEVNRSKGVAEANKIIAHSITSEYLRYFYIQQLAQVEHLGGKIIYIPTEAGLPILEAGTSEGVTVSEVEQRETELVSGTIEGINQKASDKWQVVVKPEGSQYAKNLWTKDPDLVTALTAKIGSHGAFVCGVSHWTNNEGKPVKSLWVNEVGDAAQSVATPAAPAKAAASQPDGMTPEKWDAKERRDYRSRAWAQTLGAFSHTIKVDEDPVAVFARLQPFQRHEVQTGQHAPFECDPDESGGYDISDPKHSDWHSVHADHYDARDVK